MASIKLVLDKESLDGRIDLKLDFSVGPIVLYFCTFLFSLASSFFVETNVARAALCLLFAHMANIFQLSLWETDFEILEHSNSNPASTCHTRSTSRSYRIKFLPSPIVQGSIELFFVSITPCLMAIWVSECKKLALGLLLIGLRSSLALARFWLSPDQLESSEYRFLTLFFGLDLCSVVRSMLDFEFEQNDGRDDIECKQSDNRDDMGEEEWEIVNDGSEEE